MFSICLAAAIIISASARTLLESLDRSTLINAESSFPILVAMICCRHLVAPKEANQQENKAGLIASRKLVEGRCRPAAHTHEQHNIFLYKILHDGTKLFHLEMCHLLVKLDWYLIICGAFSSLCSGCRGSRGINFVMSALVFNVVPTIFEVSLVSGILVSRIIMGFEGRMMIF